MRRLRLWWSDLPAPARVRVVRSLLLDLTAGSGAVCLTWGLALWSAPLALVVLGLLLLAAALWGTRR